MTGQLARIPVSHARRYLPSSGVKLPSTRAQGCMQSKTSCHPIIPTGEPQPCNASLPWVCSVSCAGWLALRPMPQTCLCHVELTTQCGIRLQETSAIIGVLKGCFSKQAWSKGSRVRALRSEVGENLPRRDSASSGRTSSGSQGAGQGLHGLHDKVRALTPSGTVRTAVTMKHGSIHSANKLMMLHGLHNKVPLRPLALLGTAVTMQDGSILQAAL